MKTRSSRRMRIAIWVCSASCPVMKDAIRWNREAFALHSSRCANLILGARYWKGRANVYTGRSVGAVAVYRHGDLFRLRRNCGAAKMTESDIPVYLGYCLGSFGLGYFIGMKIKAIKQFVESL